MFKKLWIYSKRREIQKIRNHMITQMYVFNQRMPGGELFLGDMSYRNGTKDLSLMKLYTLRKGAQSGKPILGCTVDNYRAIEVSLKEAESTIDRLEKITNPR